MIFTVCTKGCGDALGRAEGGVGLYRHPDGSFPGTFRNAARALAYLGDAEVPAVWRPALDLLSGSEMFAWVESLPHVV